MVRSVLQYSLLASLMLAISLILSGSAQAGDVSMRMAVEGASAADAVGTLGSITNFEAAALEVKRARARAALEIAKDRDFHKLLPLNGIRRATSGTRRFSNMSENGAFRVGATSDQLGLRLSGKEVAACYSKNSNGNPFHDATAMTVQTAETEHGIGGLPADKRGIVLMLTCQGRMVGADRDLDKIRTWEATHLVNIYVHFDDPKQLMGCSTAKGIQEMQERANANNRVRSAEGMPRRGGFGRAILDNMDMKLHVCGNPLVLEDDDRISEDFTGNMRYLATRVIPVDSIATARALNAEAPSGMPDFIRFDPEEHDLSNCDDTAIFGACGTNNALDNDTGTFRRKSLRGDGGPARGEARRLGIIRRE